MKIFYHSKYLHMRWCWWWWLMAYSKWLTILWLQFAGNRPYSTVCTHVDLISRVLRLLFFIINQNSYPFCTGKLFILSFDWCILNVPFENVEQIWKCKMYHLPCYRLSGTFFSFNPSPFFQSISWWSRLGPMTSSWTGHL